MKPIRWECQFCGTIHLDDPDGPETALCAACGEIAEHAPLDDTEQ